jgi:hypothetical protein
LTDRQAITSALPDVAGQLLEARQVLGRAGRVGAQRGQNAVMPARGAGGFGPSAVAWVSFTSGSLSPTLMVMGRPFV